LGKNGQPSAVQLSNSFIFNDAFTGGLKERILRITINNNEGKKYTINYFFQRKLFNYSVSKNVPLCNYPYH